jgi:hypothetical protein
MSALTLRDRFGSGGPMTEAGRTPHRPASMVDVVIRVGCRRNRREPTAMPDAETCSRALEAVAELYGIAGKFPLFNPIIIVSAVW